MFGRTLVLDFRISYRHIKWYLHFSQNEILLTFAIVLLVKNKMIIIIVVYLDPPPLEETNISASAKFHKHIYEIPWFKITSIYRLRKAEQGCGFSFSHVICTFFYIIFDKYHLTFNILLRYNCIYHDLYSICNVALSRGTLDRSRLLTVFANHVFMNSK